MRRNGGCWAIADVDIPRQAKQDQENDSLCHDSFHLEVRQWQPFIELGVLDMKLDVVVAGLRDVDLRDIDSGDFSNLGDGLRYVRRFVARLTVSETFACSTGDPSLRSVR